MRARVNFPALCCVVFGRVLLILGACPPRCILVALLSSCVSLLSFFFFFLHVSTCVLLVAFAVPALTLGLPNFVTYQNQTPL